MPKTKIASVGFSSADERVEFVAADSRVSLLDYDLILIRTQLDGTYAYDTYQGKPCLSDDASFGYKERMIHWRQELIASVEGGKTVIIFLGDKRDVYIASGEKRYSGTGRKQQVTRIVTHFDNYRFIPVDATFTESVGSSMIIAPKGAEALSDYWHSFETLSRYMVFIDCKQGVGSILTKNGGRTVGLIQRSNKTNGALVLLPDLDMEREEFTSQDEDGEEIWTDEAEKFFLSLTDAVVNIDRAIKSSGDVTPEPDWARLPGLRLAKETEIVDAIASATSEMEKLQSRIEKLEDDLNNAKLIKGLLYEKGKMLEKAVLEALKSLGFEARPFKDGSSEFDVVFEAEDGRLIGEVEGKDGKPINISKLRQIAMNVHEDLERAEISIPAKGVLFGNSFRLQPLNERGEPFTEKCLSASSVSSTALVYTPDLYAAAKYLMENEDQAFAEECRRRIIGSVGRVIFPVPPAAAALTPAIEEDILEQTTGVRS